VIRLTGRTRVFTPEVRISGKWGSNHGKCQTRRNRPLTWVFAFRTETPKSGGPERKGLRRACSAASASCQSTGLPRKHQETCHSRPRSVRRRARLVWGLAEKVRLGAKGR
jgi:hypothetical protein